MLRAFRPGDVVFVRLTCPIPADAQVHLAEWMARVRESTGIHVVILDHDMEIMGAQVQGPTLVQGSERHGQAEGAGT